MYVSRTSLNVDQECTSLGIRTRYCSDLQGGVHFVMLFWMKCHQDRENREGQHLRESCGSISYRSCGCWTTQRYTSWEVSERIASLIRFPSSGMSFPLRRGSCIAGSLVRFRMSTDDRSKAQSIQYWAVRSLTPVSVWSSDTLHATPPHAR